MTGLLARQFYLNYFTATRRVRCGWLACLTVEQKLGILEELMQWKSGAPEPESPGSPTQV